MLTSAPIQSPSADGPDAVSNLGTGEGDNGSTPSAVGTSTVSLTLQAAELSQQPVSATDDSGPHNDFSSGNSAPMPQISSDDVLDDVQVVVMAMWQRMRPPIESLRSSALVQEEQAVEDAGEPDGGTIPSDHMSPEEWKAIAYQLRDRAH